MLPSLSGMVGGSAPTRAVLVGASCYIHEQSRPHRDEHRDDHERGADDSTSRGIESTGRRDAEPVHEKPTDRLPGDEGDREESHADERRDRRLREHDRGTDYAAAELPPQDPTIPNRRDDDHETPPPLPSDEADGEHDDEPGPKRHECRRDRIVERQREAGVEAGLPRHEERRDDREHDPRRGTAPCPRHPGYDPAHAGTSRRAAPSPAASTGYLSFFVSTSPESAAMNASWGTSTRPTIFMRFLPSFCFSRSLRLREMSPP